MLNDLLLLVLIITGIGVVAAFLNRRLLTLLISSAFLLMVALRLDILYMYLMGTVLLALPVASYLIGRFGARSLVVERTIPETAVEGESARVRVDVYSPFALFSGFVRVNRHMPRHIRFVPRSEKVTAIPGGVRYEYDVRPQRRGVYHLSACTLTVNDPLGIFFITQRYPSSSTMVVYPVGWPLDAQYVAEASSAAWLLHTSSRRRGEEEGFYGTREYRLGDDLRRIHWRSSARHGDLVVVEREKGATSRLWLALDTRVGSDLGTDRDSTLERAIKTAVTLMDAALARGDAVGLIAPGPSGAFIAPEANEKQRYRILEALASVTADADEPLEEALLTTSAQAGARVVAITGAPTRSLAEALAMLGNVGISAVAALVDPPARSPAAPFEVLSSAEFAGIVEAAGGSALFITAPDGAERGTHQAEHDTRTR